mgnify:FL=1
MIVDLSIILPTAIGGGGIYIMQRIAAKIERRLDQVEDHEKRIAVVEARCKIFHDPEDGEGGD